MKQLLRTSLAAAAVVALAGCLGDSDPLGPICPRVEIPALAGDTVTSTTGLRYIDAAVGTGAAARASDTVRVHYTGYLLDGTRFDTSRGRGPATFPLSGVIPGFREGIVGMQTGGQRRLIIPAQLGYGGAPQPCIPAGSVLLFDVELLGIGFD